MGIKIKGAIEADQMLGRVGTDAPKRVFTKVLKAGEKLQELAIAMAPVDTGILEQAILLRTPGGGRDANGRFIRKEVEVYVDMDMPSPYQENAPANKVVGDYAYEVHEHVTPYGPDNLGPDSQAKQQSSPGVVVGGGFLERAAEQVEIDAFLEDALAGLI